MCVTIFKALIDHSLKKEYIGMSDDDDGEWHEPKIKKRRKETRQDRLRDAIYESNLPYDVQKEALSRLRNSSSDEKTFEWIDQLLKIPFNKFAKLPVNVKSNKIKIEKYFEKVSATLDKAVYGMKSVKDEVLNYIAQFISTESNTMPRVLGLCGSPGIGKTAIVRKGLAEALDRPIVCHSMGGIRDSSSFLGHDFTYQGSRCGILVQNLIKLGVMNGIMFFDEVDKISNTYDGVDIQNLLLHITDPVQNHTFNDKYFAGINIDLSRIIFVFSFNHLHLLDPILRDRIYIIKVPDPSTKEKVVIGQKYLLVEVLKNVGLQPTDIVLPEEIVQYILQRNCKNQKGVRELKKCIESLVLKINTSRFLGKKVAYKSLKDSSNKPLAFPITVTKQMVEELVDLGPEHEDNKYIASMYL